MAKHAMDDRLFEQLLSSIKQESCSSEKKLEILFRSRGFFSALQASRLLYSYAIPSDKVRTIQILEPRLCRMTCSEARDVIGSVSINNDKLKVLQSIKRYLIDNLTREGQAEVLGCFPFENDKMQAMSILHTVRNDVPDAVPAGGHQGYAALGGLYTQARPLITNLYGTVEDQSLQAPGRGAIHIPVHATHGMVPSVYTGHPTYAYPPGRNYATDRAFPNNIVYADCAAKPTIEECYPAGAPPLNMHQGGTHPTGFMGA